MHDKIRHNKVNYHTKKRIITAIGTIQTRTHFEHQKNVFIFFYYGVHDV